jgi:tetratricopeptide (TPR) repeat protein
LHKASRFPEAEEAYRAALAVSGRHAWALGGLGVLYADWGKPVRARAVYEELRARSEQEYIQPTILAMLAAAIGESDAALKLVWRAAVERDAYLSFAAVCWLSTAHLRAIPGYTEILERMGLA